MKIISVLVFGLALVGSWSLIHARRPIAESVHIGIQNDLKRVISEYIQNQLPNSQNLQFTRFWTETIKKDRVKAYFVYSFDDLTESGEPATTEIEGTALLNKVSESAEIVTWSFDELTILNNRIEFSEPIQISADVRRGQVVDETPSETNAPEDQSTPAPNHEH